MDAWGLGSSLEPADVRGASRYGKLIRNVGETKPSGDSKTKSPHGNRYLPEPEVLEAMDATQLSKWRAAETRNRKSEKQRVQREKTRAMKGFKGTSKHANRYRPPGKYLYCIILS